MREQETDYPAGDTRLVGCPAVPAETSGPLPGVLVFPEWRGVTDYPRQRARGLAAQGDVAFPADMFGDGRTTDSVRGTARLSGDTRLGPLSRQRSTAALEVLLGQAAVDADRVAAIGFCFGGDVAVELAGSGADLRGAVAFHANLATNDPAEAGRLRPKVLILHGADDPLTPLERVEGLQAELRAAQAD